MEAGRKASSEPIYDDMEPAMEWVKDHAADTLLVYLPGFKREKLKVQVTTSRQLRIMGEGMLNDSKMARFRKEIPIPSNCDANEISAKFEKGILYVRHPKIIIQDPVPPQPKPLSPAKPPQEAPQPVAKPPSEKPASKMQPKNKESEQKNKQHDEINDTKETVTSENVEEIKGKEKTETSEVTTTQNYYRQAATNVVPRILILVQVVAIWLYVMIMKAIRALRK
ncbi:uncharacterized protein LOC126688333 [Mercurialis annua]|uniref:uncharacterized protein LOC126688333 n=1 Tax=Mercurialis annua TaxID=3986 RepID=UPI00215F66B9|nr:uncharacterized protein LOC126688333 [Mercurialis annua]